MKTWPTLFAFACSMSLVVAHLDGQPAAAQPAAAQPAAAQPAAPADAAEPKPIIRVWPGKAPGSEDWTYTESVRGGARGEKSYSNVVDPTLTVFLPPPEKANGAAVIICPGGAMRVVSISDRDATAEWLNSKGIAAFILKYRLVPNTAGGPAGPRRAGPGERGGPAGRGGGFGLGQELTFREVLNRNGDANPSPDNPEHVKIIQMAIADGQQAIRLLRSDAAKYKLDPNRIGIMGFSAGGGVAVGTALSESADGYPNFVATVFGPSLTPVTIPPQAPPLFIAVMDGHFSVTNGCLVLGALWKEANRPVEMHVYDHAFGPASGMPKQNYTDRLHEWLIARRIVPE